MRKDAIPEGEIAIDALKAVDPEGAPLTFSIVSDPGDLFEIDDRVLNLRRALDFEKLPAGVIVGPDGVPVAKLAVGVSDGRNETVREFTISITDVNDNAPVIADPRRLDAKEEAPPGTVVIARLEAEDADTTGESIAWSIVGGTGEGLFAIDPQTGCITVGQDALPAYGTETSYTLKVAATDGVNTGARTIAIDLIDVNEHAPEILDPGPLTVEENAPFGTEIAGGLAAKDDDTPSSGIAWSITGGTGEGLFTIEGATGRIAVAQDATLDYETQRFYTLKVEASDGENAAARTVRIDLADANDNAPEIADPGRLSIRENSPSGTEVVAALHAEDVDTTGERIEWSIIGGTGEGLFSIDDASGRIAVAPDARLDFEVRRSYTLKVSASDGANIGTRTVVVGLADVNDNAPEILDPGALAVEENAPFGTVVGQLQATDVDTTGEPTAWSIAGGTGKGLFSIDEATGQIAVAQGAVLDYETRASYTLDITASDGLNRSTKPLTINLIDEKEGESVPRGIAVADAGDVNGDGLSDVIVGAFSARSEAGKSYVMFGHRDWSGSRPLDLASLGGIEGFALNGRSGGDRSGWAVSGAGDVNGDGFADLVVGAYMADPLNREDAGRSYVVFGKADWSGTPELDLGSLSRGNGKPGFVINGERKDDVSGFSVSGGGDINGDGLADMIVGAHWGDPNGRVQAGKSYVVFGRTDWTGTPELDLWSLDGRNGFAVKGAEKGDYTGTSVSNAGDVNGDGFDDLVVGAVFANPDGKVHAGQTYVVFGKADWHDTAALDLSRLDGRNGFALDGVGPYDGSGWSVSGAGDVNGDGYADLVVGSYQSGTIRVVFGKVDWSGAREMSLADLDGGNGFVIDGTGAFDGASASVSRAGDVNGDGYGDLVIGTQRADVGGMVDAGRSYVLYGKAAWSRSLDLAAFGAGDGLVVEGEAAQERLGYSVSGGGDVNGDGFADVILGAYGSAPGDMSGAGKRYILFGGDLTGAVDQAGTAGSDILTGSTLGDRLVGGGGDDILQSNGGADVLLGGAGDDALVVGDGAFRRLDGGSGIDTLRLSLVDVLDLTALSGERLSGIERIDLGDDTGRNRLILDDGAVRALGGRSGEGFSRLFIDGGAEDAVNLQGGFTAKGSVVDPDGGEYAVFEKAHLQVLVQTDVHAVLGSTGI